MQKYSKFDFINSAKQICIVKPDAMGDFMLALPAIDALRVICPTACLVLLVSDQVYQIARGLSSVDIVLPVSFFNRSSRGIEEINNFSKYVNSLVPVFDLTILLRWDCDFYGASQLVYSLNSRIKMAYSVACSARKKTLTPTYDQFFNKLLLDTSVTHELHKNLQLIGVNTYPNTSHSNYLTHHKIDGKSRTETLNLHSKDGFFAIAVSASQPVKKLTIDSWVKVVDALKSSGIERVLILGGQEDWDFGELIAQKTCAINLCGKFSPLELIFFLKNCRGLLAVDSFVKHAAAFNSVPVIEFSPTSVNGDFFSELGGVRFCAYGVNAAIIRPGFPMAPCSIDGCRSNQSHCINNFDYDYLLEQIQYSFQ